MERKLIQITDLNTICRICMDNKKPIMVSIFDVMLSELISYSDMLKECTSILVSIDDMLPKQLCLDCKNQLELSYKLKVQCLYSEQFMNDLITNASIQIHFVDNNLSDSEDIKENFDGDIEMDIKDEAIIKNEIPVKYTDKVKSPTFSENIQTIEYKCIRCYRLFHSKNTFVTHVKTDHNKSIRFCDYCDQIFWSESGFRRHNTQHTNHRHPEIETIDITEHTKEEVNPHVDGDDEIPCKYCPENFQSKPDLITHVREIHRNYIKECHVCNEIVWTIKEKKLHYLDQHNQCYLCYDENIEDSNELKEHLQLHSSEPFCQKCGKNCKNKRALRYHMLIHIAPKTVDITDHIEALIEEDVEPDGEEFPCKYCPENFQLKQDLITHVRYTNHTKYIGECHVCNEIFWTMKDKKLHYLDQHNKCYLCFEETVEDSNQLNQHLRLHSSGPFCHECGKNCQNKNGLRHHMRIHNVPKSYLCTYCGKKFAVLNNFKTHLRIHTGEKPYSCDLCGEKFIQWYSLRSHTITHTQEKNFKCTLCDRSFPRTNSLKRHILSHSNERNFPCDLCDKRFKTQRELTCHKIIHTGERKHACTICEKTFIRRYHLTMHLRTHDGVRPFTCTICSKEFTQKHILKTHMKIHV